jgi:AbrB family looped-hinge helix DNA binding protein
MNTVTVSPKFQVVIPKGVREKFGLKAGARLEILEYGNRIELIPLRPIKKMRGFLNGIDTNVDREQDRA